MNLPFRTSFTASHRFWYIVFPFSFVSRIFLAVPHGIWDLSSWTRGQTLQWECGVLATGLPGKSFEIFLISLLMSSLTHCLFGRVFFCIYTFVNFPATLCLFLVFYCGG